MKKVGIALGGGGAKGLAHVPMLEVVDALGIRPHKIAGTSIGAIVGVLYASGLTAQDIRDQIETMSLRDGDGFSDAFSRRRELMKWFQFVDLGWKRGSLLSPDAFLDHLMQLVRVREFDQLRFPLSVVTADFWKRDQVVFNDGDIRVAVQASMAVPGIFSPVVVGKQILVDGGVVNPVPYDLLLDDCDVTVAIDVMGNRTESEELIPSFTETIFNTFQIMEKTILRGKIAAHPPDIYVAPEILDIQMLEFYKAHEIFEQAEPAKVQLRSALEKALA